MVPKTGCPGLAFLDDEVDGTGQFIGRGVSGCSVGVQQVEKVRRIALAGWSVEKYDDARIRQMGGRGRVLSAGKPMAPWLKATTEAAIGEGGIAAGE